MILRRVTQHVKDQNWFAVGIDFIIVVVGVFIGIQVSNWNANRTDRQLENSILKRLQHQLSLVAATSNAVDDFGYQNIKELSSAREILLGVSEKTELSPEECNALGYSNIILNVGDDIPLLEELEATGRLEIISNQSIVNAILNLSSAKKREKAIIAETRPFRVELGNRFPDLIRVELTPDKASDVFEEIGRYDRTFSCDLDKMRADSAFLNAAISNSSYSFGVFEIATLPKIKATQDLIIEVNNALGTIKP